MGFDFSNGCLFNITRLQIHRCRRAATQIILKRENKTAQQIDREKKTHSDDKIK